ncbi:MAG: class I SAM-dependent methyltransferase [Leptolyngbyaceae cyanobacterium RM1_406_9]|nr:class I SAM-dependent methyltransferase [Leptolyngbyaceae cyanobacterium RM1_406_9]
MEWYKQDLAYIHDVGHSDYALKSAPGILSILAEHHIHDGLIVDLGCGSGLSALEFTAVRYQVLGVDISESMIALARTRVPTAEFRVESLFETDIPACNAVVSIGECLNYLFDANNTHSALVQLFQRVYNALNPGGVFIFDIAEPGQMAQGIMTKNFTEGEDWIVLVEKQEEQAVLTRRIITLRKLKGHHEGHYRRDDEVHHLRLYEATEVAEQLHQVGFQVQIMRRYGDYDLPKAHAAFVACKPPNAQRTEKW